MIPSQAQVEVGSRLAAEVILFNPIETKADIAAASDLIAQRVLTVVLSDVEQRVNALGHPSECGSYIRGASCDCLLGAVLAAIQDRSPRWWVC